MMPTPTLSTAIILALVAIPVTATAYIPPQDKIYSDEFIGGILVPPSRREAEERVKRQNAESKARREAEQAATFGGGAVAEEDDEPMHAAADDEGTVSPDLVNVLTSIEQTLADIKNDSTNSATLRRERALARLEAIEAQREDGNVAYINGGEQLHGGAPLAPTGPETWMTGGALTLAVAWTLWQSRREARGIA